jgi:hypothetical protein
MNCMAARISILCVCLALESSAFAASNDFRLNAHNPNDVDQGILFDISSDSENSAKFIGYRADAYRALIGELAFVFSPRSVAPAETLGHSGFHLGVSWSGTMVSNKESFWLVTEEGQRSKVPNKMLQTLQLDIRKGLPLSFELGTSFMWLVESEMFAPGLELRWALHEGYHLAPDLALRAGVNHVVGNRDLNLTIVSLGAVLSRSFGVAGMVNVAPYLGYSFMMLAASSRVIDATPSDDQDQADLKLPGLDLTENVEQKLSVGARFLFSLFNISVQGEFEFLPKTSAGVKAFGDVMTITTKLGLNY